MGVFGGGSAGEDSDPLASLREPLTTRTTTIPQEERRQSADMNDPDHPMMMEAMGVATCAAAGPSAQRSLAQGFTRPPPCEVEAAAIQTRRRAALSSATRWTYYLLAGVVLAVALPAGLYFLASQNADGRAYQLPLAASFVGCAVPVSLWGIFSHVFNYWQPTLQKYVIRILWMVPVYSVTSLAELLLWLRVEQGHANAARWTDVPRAFRDCYESYTVLNFFYFMLAFLEISNGEPAAKVLRRVTAPAPRTRRWGASAFASRRRRQTAAAAAATEEPSATACGPAPRDEGNFAVQEESVPAPTSGTHNDEADDAGTLMAADDDDCSGGGQEEGSDDEEEEEEEEEESDNAEGGSSPGTFRGSSQSRTRAVRHPCPPYSWFCGAWRLDTGEFLEKTKYGVLLYATLMPLCALTLIIASAFSATGTSWSDGALASDASSSEDDDDDAEAVVEKGPSKRQLREVFSAEGVAFFVQFMASNHAIYCLVLFYAVSHKLLAPCRPHLKFVAVKGVVFGTFFQNLGIDAIFYLRPSLARAFTNGDDDAVDAALGSVQSTLMCVEMLAFAILHAFAFPTAQFPRVKRRRLRDDNEGVGSMSLEDHDNDDETRDHADDDTDDVVAPACREWLAAWGDFYAAQREARAAGGDAGWCFFPSRRAGHTTRSGAAPGSPTATRRRRDVGFSPSSVLFDVRDVHADTTATMRGLGREVADPILRESRQSTSLLHRVVARWRYRPPNSVAFARFAARSSGAPNLV